MPSRRFPKLSRCVLIALALAGLVLLASVLFARRTLPQISGTLHVPGLHSTVTVARDGRGVPHIYASDEHDLFLAQGYVTAQDRLWQMLLRRQAARGQLSAWLGSRALAADVALRREDLPAYAATLMPDLEQDTLNTLEAYAHGVNACLKSCPDSPELEWLKRQGKLKQVEAWTAADSLALALATQWAQDQQSGVGLRQKLETRLGTERAADLWPQAAIPTGPTFPADPAVRQVARWIGLPLFRDEPLTVASAPGLPVAWYVASLRSDRTAITGGTWAGVPGVMVNQAYTPPSVSAFVPGQQRDLIQHLLALPPQGWLQVRVHGMLCQWDFDLSGKTRLGNASAAVYEVWAWYLARDTFQDELGPELFNRYWATGLAPEVLARLAGKTDDLWWDDVTTPKRETRDDIMSRAYAEALEYLGRHYGDLHTIWEWNTMHAAQLQHPLSDAWPLSWLLDRTIDPGDDAPFDPAQPEDALNAYAPVWILSLRINADGFALAGGQSGNPISPHYADLLSLWARGQLAPLQDAARPQDLQDVEGVLTLAP